MKNWDYQQLRKIPMPVLEARERLLKRLDFEFKSAGNTRAWQLARQGIDWGDMWHTDEIKDREMQKLVRGYLKYHTAHVSLRMNISTLKQELYRYTGDFRTNLSVAEVVEAHLARLRAKCHNA